MIIKIHDKILCVGVVCGWRGWVIGGGRERNGGEGTILLRWTINSAMPILGPLNPHFLKYLVINFYIMVNFWQSKLWLSLNLSIRCSSCSSLHLIKTRFCDLYIPTLDYNLAKIQLNYPPLQNGSPHHLTHAKRKRNHITSIAITYLKFIKFQLREVGYFWKYSIQNILQTLIPREWYLNMITMIQISRVGI